MIIVAGLGNPDEKYKNNVHNLGFMVIDRIAEKLGVKIDKKGHKALYAILNVQGEKVILLKPQTYMNLSGESVQKAMSFYKVPMDKLLVIYDDIDIPVGSLRIRERGSAGTHNGMKNIVMNLSSTDFPRIRVGAKPTDFKGSLIDYVLSNVNGEDYEGAIERASNAGLSFIKGEKIDIIMNKFNG